MVDRAVPGRLKADLSWMCLSDIPVDLAQLIQQMTWGYNVQTTTKDWKLAQAGPQNKMALVNACKNGHVPIAQWFCRFGLIYWNDVIKSASMNGHLELVQWATNEAERCWLSERAAGFVKPGHTQWSEAFILACTHGHLLVGQWFYDTTDLATTDLNRAFIAVCGVGDLTIARWLVSKGANDWHGAFEEAGEKREIEVIRWMHKMGKIDWDRVSSEGIFDVEGILIILEILDEDGESMVEKLRRLYPRPVNQLHFYDLACEAWHMIKDENKVRAIMEAVIGDCVRVQCLCDEYNNSSTTGTLRQHSTHEAISLAVWELIN